MPLIKVSFYNRAHEDILKETPKYKDILELVKRGFHCSNEDLWTYALFKEQKPFPGFNTYQELKLLLPGSLAKVKRYYELDNRTIRAKVPGGAYQELTEELGIGAALAIVSHIHGLTEADWNVIRVSEKKDLDFSINPNKHGHRIIKSLQKADLERPADSSDCETSIKIASDGERIIEVEAKGSYVNEDKITSSISKMKAHIEDKKDVQRSSNNKNLLYGIITSYSQHPAVIAHSRILDPPVVFNYEDSPRKLRLLSRLNFYLDKPNLLSRANYLIALANRIGDIRALINYEPLDSQPLLNQRGESFEIPTSYSVTRTKVAFEEGGFVGEVFPVNSAQYFFFGIDLEIIEKLIYQSFSDILSYRCDLPRLLNITVDAKLKTQDLDLYRIDYVDLSRARDIAVARLIRT